MNTTPKRDPLKDAVKAAINDPAQPSKPQPTKRTFTPLRDLAKKHPGAKPMMVRDYFPTSSIFTVFGEPGLSLIHISEPTRPY